LDLKAQEKKKINKTSLQKSTTILVTNQQSVVARAQKKLGKDPILKKMTIRSSII
jgi:hypothetical protein